MIYRPLLRWKRGEQTALTNLVAAHNRVVEPLLTVTGHSYNPLSGDTVDAAFDARITHDAVRLRLAWTGHRASVDLATLDPDAECHNGQHPLSRFFDALAGRWTRVQF
ncbi:beta family protein [Kaistia terrae]|uniref:Uncharacterized protein n=1 Tax=Kaistia terrae TaxID=537017 RepID=A0ABW0Q1W2_9HYPH